MIERSVFYDRLDNHCKPCSEWNGACLRGHGLHSPTGCPLHKFEPVNAAGYDVDRPRTSGNPGCPSCAAKANDPVFPEMTWPQVMQHFASSMVEWAKSGLATVSSGEHKRRYTLCQSCPQYTRYHCKICKCLVYTKTKMATEKCPLGGW